MTDSHFKRLHAAFAIRSLPNEPEVYSKEAFEASLRFLRLLQYLEGSHRKALIEKDLANGMCSSFWALPSPVLVFKSLSGDASKSTNAQYNTFSMPNGDHQWLYVVKSPALFNMANDPAKHASAMLNNDEPDFSGTLSSIIMLLC